MKASTPGKSKQAEIKLAFGIEACCVVEVEPMGTEQDQRSRLPVSCKAPVEDDLRM